MTDKPTNDWVVQVVDVIDRVVATVRDKTTKPAVYAVRGLVYGLLAAIVGVAVVVLFAIAAIRALDLLPGGVWVADFIVGGMFVLIGLLLMRSRHSNAH